MDEDKTVLIELYPRGHETVYNVFVTFYNYIGLSKGLVVSKNL